MTLSFAITFLIGTMCSKPCSQNTDYTKYTQCKHEVAHCEFDFVTCAHQKNAVEDIKLFAKNCLDPEKVSVNNPLETPKALKK